jgi:enoyl-CoA hydratase/carnithine racemase
MSQFDEYCHSYKFIRLKRLDGILEMSLHTNGGPLQWGLEAQAELGRAFSDVGADRENRVIILTGSGDEFSGPRLDPDATEFFHGAELTSSGVHSIHWNARRLMTTLLDIEVPMIGVVNGPAKRHAELALMCDIVIAADDATFEDTAHFHLGSIVPGDGINIVYTMLMGLNRARYLMLTGQVLSARDAKDMGLVAELLPRHELAARAWALARQLAKKPEFLLRYTRMVLTHPLKKLMDEGLQYSLALETLGALDKR